MILPLTAPEFLETSSIFSSTLKETSPFSSCFPHLARALTLQNELLDLNTVIKRTEFIGIWDSSIIKNDIM